MSEELSKIQIIERACLSEEFYFKSLLDEAQRWGLLSGSDIEKLQLACLDLLARQAKLFNSGISDSIRVEKAQEIMESVLFTLGLRLKTYPNPDDAVTALLTEPLGEIYKKGRERIDSMLTAVKKLHLKLTQRLFSTANEFYSETLVDGINGFFKLYYPDFSAQEIHITADYPLFNPVPKLLGIEFIKSYLEAAWCENLFCGYFSEEDVHYLLLGFAEDYGTLLINIYEPTLTAALGCVITGADFPRLDITREDVRRLTEIFKGHSQTEILKILTNAADTLNRHFQFPAELKRYIRASLSVITDNIRVASRENIFRRVFFPTAKPEVV